MKKMEEANTMIEKLEYFIESSGKKVTKDDNISSNTTFE